MLISLPMRPSTVPVIAVVPTCAGREDLLLGRALPSIYAQEAAPRRVLVVADRDVPPDDPLHDRIAQTRRAFLSLRLGVQDSHVPDDLFPTALLENRRTRGHAVTGSVNTAVDMAVAEHGTGWWLTTLDDDDAWHPPYLRRCVEAAHGAPGPRHMVANGHRRLTTRHVQIRIPRTDLCPKHVFLGSPGIQGSNLMVSVDLFLEVGGYDETFPSTTDRDILVRLLDALADRREALVFVRAALVDHYADNHDRVTTGPRKHEGLDRFYARYRHRMSPEVYALSMRRARAVFGYVPIEER
ncbi:MAG: glycosyltransferase family 2 protein [Deltaproteobacteria bacterium]|nr:glycosyltransferase family 2 protein [Deltaproteobacteria bacterium]